MQCSTTYDYKLLAIANFIYNLITCAVPEIRFLKCPDKMSEQSSDIMEFWSGIDRKYIVFIITLCGTLSEQIDFWSDNCQKWLEIVRCPTVISGSVVMYC